MCEHFDLMIGGRLSARSAIWLLVAGLVFCTGCGPSTPFTLVPASGKVSYEDGSAIPGPPLLVTFVPQTPPANERDYPRPATGLADATGAFDCLTTVRYGDGATVGPNKVLVVSQEANRPTGAVPLDWASADKTPLVVEVSAGHGPYDIKIPKPQFPVGQR